MLVHVHLNNKILKLFKSKNSNHCFFLLGYSVILTRPVVELGSLSPALLTALTRNSNSPFSGKSPIVALLSSAIYGVAFVHCSLPTGFFSTI